MTPPVLHVVLFQPEIPPNTGNAGRLCLGIGARLHVVHPIPFSMDAKAVRRAGLDYWPHVDLQEHADADAFFAWCAGRRVFGYTARSDRPHTAAQHEEGDVLVFGCETRGLPESVRARLDTYTIPMTGPIRSLNLSNAVAVVTYRALEQVRPTLFASPR